LMVKNGTPYVNHTPPTPLLTPSCLFIINNGTLARPTTASTLLNHLILHLIIDIIKGL
jgi:hypothetical protein